MFEIRCPTTLDAWTAVRALLVDYAQSLNIDLCFQNFEAELAELPGEYSPPRGAFMTVHAEGILVGCCALRPLDSVDYPNAAEMKRLYIRPAYRGNGLGRLLTESILDAARHFHYAYVLLDTLSGMETARNLYGDLGFEEVAPYYFNPIEGAHYLIVRL